MWTIGDYPAHLRGFYYYKAATYGDGLCLPIMFFCLSAFNSYQGGLNKANKNRYPILIGVVATILGVLVQISWLLNPDIVLNWTIPQAGHFNVPGWYHAFFFSLMFGMSAYQISLFLIVLKNSRTELSQFEQQLCGGFVASGSAFLMLHFGDDYGEKAGYVTLLLITGILIFTGLMGIFLMTKIKLNNILAMVLMGLLLAFGVATWIFLSPQNGQILISLGGALCACVLWKEDKIEQIISTTIETIVAVFLCLYTATATDVWSYKLMILGVVLVVTIMISHINYGGFQWHFLPITVIPLYIIRPLVVGYISSGVLEEVFGIAIVDFLFYMAFYIFFYKEICNRFDYVKEIERKKNNGCISEDEFGLQKGISYTNILFVTIAIFCVLLQWLIDVGSKAIVNGPVSGKVGNASIELIGISVCLLCLIIAAIGQRKKRADEFLAYISAIVVYFLISLYEIKSTEINIQILIGMESYLTYLVLISIFAIIGYPILLSQGFYMNLASLRGNSKENIDHYTNRWRIGEFFKCYGSSF